MKGEGGAVKSKVSLARIAGALERISPPPATAPDMSGAAAFVWHVAPDRLSPVSKVARVDLPLLVGIDRSRDTLLDNTLNFAQGLPANNALLWGARGMGKSSLVKAVHAEVCAQGFDLKIVEVQREDLPSIGRLLTILRDSSARFLLFCDDLSFSHDDQHYKSLKAVLDGGIGCHTHARVHVEAVREDLPALFRLAQRAAQLERRPRRARGDAQQAHRHC